MDSPFPNTMKNPLDDLTIYVDGDHLSIPEALEAMTDDALDDGECRCVQTVMDLRDALRVSLEYIQHHE